MEQRIHEFGPLRTIPAVATLAVVADGLAEAQVRFPSVPLVFCETRPLAEEWTYRFLGAALDELSTHPTADKIAADLNRANIPGTKP